MAWRKRWQARCERCDALGPADVRSRGAEKKAVAAGWLLGRCYGMALHLCPACVALGLPDWWPDSTGLDFHWEAKAKK